MTATIRVKIKCNYCDSYFIGVDTDPCKRPKTRDTRKAAKAKGWRYTRNHPDHKEKWTDLCPNCKGWMGL